MVCNVYRCDPKQWIGNVGVFVLGLPLAEVLFPPKLVIQPVPCLH
jgi:hypothetical protein